jgi:hypothetical protein
VKRIRVDIEIVEKILKERKAINIIPFYKIDWYKNGKKLYIPKKVLDEWKFTGLSNTDFVSGKVYKATILKEAK